MPPAQWTVNRNRARRHRRTSDANDVSCGGRWLYEGHASVPRDPQRVPLDPPEVGPVGARVSIEKLQSKHVREFLDWVYERAVADRGTNPGRTANKASEHLRAVLSWAWEQELLAADRLLGACPWI